MQDPNPGFLAILDAMPLKFFHKDTTNRIRYCNQAVADSLGVTTAEMADTPTERWYPEEAERYYQDDLEAIRSGLPKLGIVEPLFVVGKRSTGSSPTSSPPEIATATSPVS